MGQAKLKQQSAFPSELIEEWESEDCVNFSIALARLTGWLIHVDWWSTSTKQYEPVSVNDMHPLRVYVGDNGHRIFDVRGNKSIFEFTDKIIRSLAFKIAKGPGGVRTKFYGEDALAKLPLKHPPVESKIQKIMLDIQSNQHFLSSIPIRKPPMIPAHKAAEFTFGRCSAYTEALKEVTGETAVGLLAVRFSPHFELTERGDSGYFHSIIQHANGMGEDSWGKASIDDIAARFGVLEYRISDQEHEFVVQNHLSNSKELYLEALEDARDLIKLYRRP